MENPSASTLDFNLDLVSPTEILKAIHLHLNELAQMESGDASTPALSIRLVGAKGQDYLGAGIRGVSELAVHGRIGDFGLCSFGDGQCLVEGNVGDFFGHSIASGVLIVNGNAGNAVGALGAGGLIAIYGNSGDRIAVGLQGADVVVRGSVGNYAGIGMQSGTLVVTGSAGQLLGHAMSGGTIYLRGDASSISSDIEEQRLREPDRLKIGLMMLKSNITGAGKEFRVFRSTRGGV
jgi:glutamate synthase domain-containing protein 3